MNDRPREGIYLDAALGVIGEQVEERIDELGRRRRVRARLGVFALALAVVVGGSTAAYALVQGGAAPQATSTADAATSLMRLSCVEGSGTGASAYFTASYRIAADAAIDAAAVCADARATLASDQDRIAQASPRDLVAIAKALMNTDEVAVHAATFGVLDDEPVNGSVVCEGPRSTIVMLMPAASGIPRQYTTCSVSR